MCSDLDNDYKDYEMGFDGNNTQPVVGHCVNQLRMSSMGKCTRDSNDAQLTTITGMHLLF